MADEQKGAVAAGFALLWRRQGVLWWVFVVNFICGAFGAVPAMMTLSHALGGNLAGEKLTRGFDLGVFNELMRLPEVDLPHAFGGVYMFAALFMLFLLFVMGGILESYGQDRRLSTGEFFAACGAFFWRFVRLALLSIIPFVMSNPIALPWGNFSPSAKVMSPVPQAKSRARSLPLSLSISISLTFQPRSMP